MWDYLPKMHGFQNNIDVFKASQVLAEVNNETPKEEEKQMFVPWSEWKKTLTLENISEI